MLPKEPPKTLAGLAELLASGVVTQENVESALAAHKMLARVDNNISQTHNAETIAYFEIMRVLLGGEKAWSGIRSEAKVAQATLARKLKELVEVGIIERRVVPSFPPRSMYKIATIDPLIMKILDLSKRSLEMSDQLAYALLDYSAFLSHHSGPKPSTQEQYTRLINTLYLTILTELHGFLMCHPDEIKDTRWVPLFKTFRSISIMRVFWVVCEALSYDSKVRSESEQIVVAERNRLEYPTEEQALLRKIAEISQR